MPPGGKDLRMQAAITFLPSGRTVKVKQGMTILEAGKKAGEAIRTRCAGKAACLMCKVVVQEQTGLSPVNRIERLKLGDLADRNYRLACQSRIWADVKVEVPEDPLKAVIRKKLASRSEDDL